MDFFQVHVMSCHKKICLSGYAVSRGSDQTVHSDHRFDFGVIYMGWTQLIRNL